MQGAFFLKLGDLNRHEVKTTLQEAAVFHKTAATVPRRLFLAIEQVVVGFFFSQLLLQVLHPPPSQITAVLIALFHPCYGLLKETLA